MKKYLSMLLAAGMMVGCLTACGGTTPATSEAPASEAPVSEAPVSEAPAAESAGITGMSAEAVFTGYEAFGIPAVEGEAKGDETVYASVGNAGERGAEGCGYEITVDGAGNVAAATVTLSGAEDDAEALEDKAMEFFAVAVLNPYDTGDEAGLSKWLKINLPNADEAGKYLVKGEARFDLFKTVEGGTITYTLTIAKH